MSTSSITSDDIGLLQEAEQGQAIPIDNRSRRITIGNLVLNNNYYSPSS